MNGASKKMHWRERVYALLLLWHEKYDNEDATSLYVCGIKKAKW